MNTGNIFGAIADWKAFERLCADLLEAEGHTIVSEPFVDRSGTDLLTTQEFRSHSNDSIRLTWHVQCKHFASSGNNLGRKDADEILNCYGAAKRPGEGLLIMVDTDYSEEAKNAIDRFLANHPDARIELWNQRQLRTKIERHPHLLVRYGLTVQGHDFLSVFADLKQAQGKSVLLLSDQSAFAHDLTSVLRALAAELTFLPFWNYQLSARSVLMLTSLPDKFDLVIVFLGDSFGLPIPDDLVNVIRQQHEAGAALLLFPFVAWSMHQGAYTALADIVPVRLVDPQTAEHLNSQRITGDFRRGDFRWLLAFDSFAEDHYVECDPAQGTTPFVMGITSRFGVSHSFEYLRLHGNARCAWPDTTGNPLVVTSAQGPGRVCYVNTCCHSCMTIIPVRSPLEASPPFTRLLRNVIDWLLGSAP